jgi:hypothetical protein
MKLPVEKMNLPAELKGHKNGELPASLLVPCGIGNFKMTPRAAAAMRALVAAATAAGFQVRATGTYRDYDGQERLFRSRYTREYLPGRPSKLWNGETWHQLPGTSMAAVPSTSNHGLGVAIDFAEERDGDPQVESVSTAFVTWLVGNAHRFGFSAEAQSEPWHWRYVAGDKVPAEVAAFNGTSPSTPPAPPPAAPTRPTLRRGSKGVDVKLAQQALTAKGFPTAPDGDFGPKTEAAVRAFQRSRKLAADGVIGPRTWAALLG